MLFNFYTIFNVRPLATWLLIKKKCMKLTVVNTKKSTLVNLNGLLNRVQMNTKKLSGIAIVITMKLQNNFGTQITTSAWIRRKLLIVKVG